MPSQLFLIALALVLTSCASQLVPGRMSIAIPPQFKNTVKEELIQPTHPDPNEGPARTFTQPTRIVSGRWLDPAFVSYTRSGTYYGNTKYRTWSIEVTKGADRDVVKALENNDAFKAAEVWAIDSSPRICPRIEQKKFSWGEAITFLTQYQNDNTNYVPNNGMLEYQVHGITWDRRYTIRAQFGITHPRLTEFGPKVRYRDPPGTGNDPGLQMRKDPDYVLVEKSSPEKFQPSIREIDAMLDGLRVE
jgi:hypothetical protein